MQHTKGWLIFCMTIRLAIGVGLLAAAIYWGVCEEIVIAGIMLGMLAWGFLVDGLKDAFALKRRNWIDRQAIYELYQEEVEQRKRELKVIKEINELYEEPRNKQ